MIVDICDHIRHRGRWASILWFATKKSNKFQSFVYILLFCSDCEHVRMLWSQHRQLFDIGGKYQVLRFLDDKVLKKESCHLPDAGHGHVATDAIVRSS